VPALLVVLQSDPAGPIEERGEVRCELRVAFDLAGDVANHATQAGAQELQRSPGALELMGVAVAAMMAARLATRT
jgi:hypothetical protein